MIYLNDLVGALREELQQYGEMLARFDDAEACLPLDIPAGALRQEAALQDQEQAVKLALAQREHAQGRLARYLGLPDERNLAEIIPLLPSEHQPLVRALMEENRELSLRVRQRASRDRQWPAGLCSVEGCSSAA